MAKKLYGYRKTYRCSQCSHKVARSGGLCLDCLEKERQLLALELSLDLEEAGEHQALLNVIYPNPNAFAS
jgi:hypothetical protein